MDPPSREASLATGGRAARDCRVARVSRVVEAAFFAAIGRAGAGVVERLGLAVRRTVAVAAALVRCEGGGAAGGGAAGGAAEVEAIALLAIARSCSI